MRQYVETYTTLEMRRKVTPDEWQVWGKPLAGMFRTAQELAYQGRIIEAIDEAQKIQVENHGFITGVEFRCVTKTTTITATTALNEGWTAS